jgi:murein DD-endopeptidase MepM/ murein hydrolase activator NlpD
MKLKDLINIKSLLIITFSDKPSSESSKFNLSAKKFLTVFTLYSLVMFVAGFLIINLTPLSKIFYSEDYYYQKEEQEKYHELNKKLLFLSKEIEELKTTNDRLKYAITLGDSNLLKPKNDSVKNNVQKLRKKVEGNVLFIFQFIWNNIFSSAKKDNFFTRPINGFISREFNPDEGHYGIDIVAKTGAPIYAAASGYVIFSDYTVDDGYMIIIIHPNDYISVYKHCSSLLKRKREKIIQGDMIALSGNTGHKSHGPHLHFEIWKNGQPLNPQKLFIN